MLDYFKWFDEVVRTIIELAFNVQQAKVETVLTNGRELVQSSKEETLTVYRCGPLPDI